MRILILDNTGQPKEWRSREDAIVYHAKGLVAWQLGEGKGDVTFRGGDNRLTGQQSRITTAPIVAIRGKSASAKRAHKTPSLTNHDLFARDCYICAYCSHKFKFFDLSRDHVIPRSRGGKDVWTNVVTACLSCNHRKDDHLLEEVGMKLIYVPYAPNLAEALILENRNVLSCQMEYLQSFIPQHSRVWGRIKTDYPELQH